MFMICLNFGKREVWFGLICTEDVPQHYAPTPAPSCASAFFEGVYSILFSVYDNAQVLG